MRLSGLTDSFLPDIKINLSSVHFLVTLNGGSTGLPLGVYMYFQSNLIQGIFDAITNLLNHLGGILKIFNFKMPSINVGEIDFGVFFTSEAMGFKFNVIGLDVQCMYQLATKKGSCKFNSNIFTALLDAGKWVIKEAKELFDVAGKEIVVVGQHIKDFSEKTFKDVKNGVQVIGKDVGHALTTAGKDVGHAVTTVGKDIGHEAQKGVSTVSHEAAKGVNTAKTAAKKVGNFFKHLF